MHLNQHFLFAGKIGTQVVVPYRDEDEARLLKPMGDLGQIVRMVGAFSFRLGVLALIPPRNGIFGTKTKLQSACDTPIPSTIWSGGTMKPSSLRLFSWIYNILTAV